MEASIASFTIVKLLGVPPELLGNLPLPHFKISDHARLMVLQPNLDALRYRAEAQSPAKDDHQPQVLNIIFDSEHNIQSDNGSSRRKGDSTIVHAGGADFESFERFSTLIADEGYSDLQTSSDFWIPTQSVLTYREIEVLHYVYDGRSSKKIADELNLSSRTVELHRQNCSKKLGAITPRILSMLFSIKVLETYLWTRCDMLKENVNKEVATN